MLRIHLTAEDLLKTRFASQPAPLVESAFRSDLAWRGRLIGEVGARAAISSLHPGIGWNGPVLQIETPKELDFYPGGAGLTLMPTAMWTGRAMVAGRRDGPVTIVYPAVTRFRWSTRSPGTR
jgi:hypothetical protein